jgi:hypothetical protein
VTFTCIPKQGYFLEFSDSPPRYEHFLGGKAELPGAFCLPCKRPLLLMAALDTRDPRLGLNLRKSDRKNRIHLPLLYCWSCGTWLSYRLNTVGGIDALDNENRGSTCFPYEPYPKSFPARWVRLVPVAPEIQRLIRRSNEGKLKDNFSMPEERRQYLRPRHQLGGQAFFQQGLCLKDGCRCTLCGKNSPFLASIGNETGGGKTFYGANYLLQTVFHFCESCQVVCGHHECD